jgi:hypothetical protein
MRQARHREFACEMPTGSPGRCRLSPQRAQASPLGSGNSVQHTSQIGTEESCGRGDPQRVQLAGRRAQLRASPRPFRGLRSTRATARHRDDPDGVTSNVSEPEFLRKTHLTSRRTAKLSVAYTPPCTQYTHTRCDALSQSAAGRPPGALQGHPHLEQIAYGFEKAMPEARKRAD